MTLQIRWDASDTVYISGPPGNRFVHFPLEISSNITETGSVNVIVTRASTGVSIAEQTFNGVPFTAGQWVKFSPALLVDDQYFTQQETFRLLAVAFNEGGTTGILQKDISNVATGTPTKNWLLVALGAGLLFLALGKRRFLR